MKALAIIIGNSEYENNLLDNPVNDAVDFADVLKRLGFDVILKTNIDQQSLNIAIDSFGKSLNDFDIGLFYFAGHGVQIEGENFLAVTNTNFESETSVQYSSLTLNKVLTYMERAENKTNIVILDACRDNPYEKSWDRSIAKKGLAPMYAPKGTLIAYATSPGQRAKDGIGRNGLYTSALLKHILDENISIEEFFKRVRNSVYAFSNGKQTTWEHTSLTGNFVFNSGQLIHSLETPYSPTVIRDTEAVIEGGTVIDEILLGLKTYNWYKQNPAIDRIYNTDLSNVDKDKQFLLGRNILQSAIGSSGSAISFMENLDENIRKYSVDNNNHILNGILFEIYFNSEGKFRNKNLKSYYLQDLMALEKIAEYRESFVFIRNQLLPYDKYLFFIPGKHSESITFDIVFEKKQNAEVCEYFVKDIVFEGEPILKIDKRNAFFGDDETIYYEPFYFLGLPNRIAELSGIPLKFIRLNTNEELQDKSMIKFPLGHYISKLEEE
jgi:hypothetical protein